MSAGRIVIPLVIACLSLAASGPAMAQQRGSSANSGPGAYSAADPYGSNASLRDAMDSMKAGNYPSAERKFLEYLQVQPKDARANFQLGVAEMMQGKWPEAKTYLEIAVINGPREPDPKSRLGLTLVKLGDVAGAQKQRDELAKMDASCKGKCPNAKWIAADLKMVDDAIAGAKAAPAAKP